MTPGSKSDVAVTIRHLHIPINIIHKNQIKHKKLQINKKIKNDVRRSASTMFWFLKRGYKR